jgi:hypothetical protein
LGGRRRKVVRSRANFCQVGREKEKNCQKKGKLLPGLEGEGEKLSEERRTSAMLGVRMRKVVRRRANFCQVKS